MDELSPRSVVFVAFSYVGAWPRARLLPISRARYHLPTGVRVNEHAAGDLLSRRMESNPGQEI